MSNRIKRGTPQHVALIMDGNGRWAKQRLLPRSIGHQKGFERMVALTEHAFLLGLSHWTVYALSLENLSRPKEEVENLYNLFRTYFNAYMGMAKEKKARIRALGEISLLPKDLQELLRKVEEETSSFKERTLNVAVCYGGQQEILRAVNRAIKLGNKVTKDSFENLLYTEDVPPPDLIIRTGKEVRLSNFLLYQAAYSELYFSKKLFPDFTNKDLERAIESYQNRMRKFGKTEEQLE